MEYKKSQHFSRRDADDERDDFWSVDKLLPQGSSFPKPLQRVGRGSTDAVDVDVPPPIQSLQPHTHLPKQPVHSDQPITHRSEPKADHGGGAYPTTHADQTEEPAFVYEAEGILLHTVKVYTWRTSYHYFDQFISDAQKYAAMKGREARREPFFSYFPQYAQMNRRQLAWYLWWREQVRAGVYPETDYAYVLLYLFELLNLPVSQDVAEQTRDTMAKLWVVYRQAYPQLDHYMCEWLCDYCLIHRLIAPTVILMPVLGEIIATARLKEFYLSAMIAVGNGEVNLASARILLSYCCQYDYRKSKFASGEHKKMFDTLIPGAVAATLPLLLGQKGHPAVLSMDDSYISRDAYVGALCAHGNKRRIEISYTSFSRSHDLRFLIGDMVRHAENRLRASMGVRSRLTTHFLGNPLKDALDAWLDPRLPHAPTAAETAAKTQPRPAYEAFYDSPHTQVSLASADEIERASWETTRILTEAFEEDVRVEETLPTTTPTPASTPVPADDRSSSSPSPLISALGDKVAFLRAVLNGDRAGQSAYCRAAKTLPDAVADEINEMTTQYEIFDMVLEDMGDGYEVIPDYEQVLSKLLNGDV